MVIETTEILTGAAVVLVAGAIGTVAKHIYNNSKHPCQENIDKQLEKKVDKSVCEAKGECIEAELKAVNNRITDMQGSINGRFDTMDGYFKQLLERNQA